MNSIYTLSCKHLSIFLPSASTANRSSCNVSSSVLHSASSVCLSCCNVPRTDSRQISAKIHISRLVRHTAFREACFTQLSASVWHVATFQELTVDRIEPKFSHISPLHDSFHCDMTLSNATFIMQIRHDSFTRDISQMSADYETVPPTLTRIHACLGSLKRDMTHLHVTWLSSFLRDMTHSHVTPLTSEQTSRLCLKHLHVFIRDTTHSQVMWIIYTWHDSTYSYVTWLIRTWRGSFTRDMTHLILTRHDSFTRDMTHPGADY